VKVETSLNRSALGQKKYGQFRHVRGVAGFVRLLLQRIVQERLKKLANIQSGRTGFLRIQFREVSLYLSFMGILS
jgi:hypothetical protein